MKIHWRRTYRIITVLLQHKQQRSFGKEKWMPWHYWSPSRYGTSALRPSWSHLLFRQYTLNSSSLSLSSLFFVFCSRRFFIDSFQTKYQRPVHLFHHHLVSTGVHLRFSLNHVLSLDQCSQWLSDMSDMVPDDQQGPISRRGETMISQGEETMDWQSEPRDCATTATNHNLA